MLVLHRRAGQKIIIGDATVTICKYDGNGVKVGIEAPRSTLVYRSEVAGQFAKCETAETIPTIWGTVEPAA